jgi:hypothetical protein
MTRGQIVKGVQSGDTNRIMVLVTRDGKSATEVMGVRCDFFGDPLAASGRVERQFFFTSAGVRVVNEVTLY